MINIATSIDKNFIQHCYLMLSSLCNNSSENLDIYIIHDGIEIEDLKVFKQLEKKHKINISYILFNKQVIKNAPIAEHINLLTYNRFFLPEILPHLKKILYLDSDIIVNANIAELWNTEIKNYSLAAVRNPMISGQYKSLLGLSKEVFFNGGVLFINLDYWRNIEATNKLVNYTISNIKTNLYWDQDALNYVFHNSWKEIHPKWNVQRLFFVNRFDLNFDFDSTLAEQAVKNPAIIHFTGPFSAKPWDFYSLHPYDLLYRKYKNNSPFENEKYKNTPKKRRKRIKQYIIRRKYLLLNRIYPKFLNWPPIALFKTKLKTSIFYFKPRKIVAQYKLFFGEEWLEASVDSIAPFVHKILFVVSDIAWGDDPKQPDIKVDDLEVILARVANKYPNKAIIVKGSWDKQLEHVQAGLNYIKKQIPEATHCLYIDGDEIYRQEQIKALLKLVKLPKYFNKAIRINYNTYFKTIYYKVWPIKYPTALVLFPIMPWVRYRRPRNVNATISERKDLFYEHPAYVRFSDEKMRLKIEAHKETEPIIANWYHDVWQHWHPQIKNFHPTHPVLWPGLVEVDAKELPPEMISTYRKWKN